MGKKIIIKITAGLLVVIMTLQGGTVLYSYAKEWNWPGFTAVDKEEEPASKGMALNGQKVESIGAVSLTPFSSLAPRTGSQSASQQAQSAPTALAHAEIIVSEEVLEAIRLADPVGHELNTASYKGLLAELQVHDLLHIQLDHLILTGGKVQDILTAYDFAYRQFGSFEDVEKLLIAKGNDQAWAEVFQAYLSRTPAFIPQAFDSDYLESLLQAPSLTADDVMIADHISFKTGKEVPQLIAMRLEGGGWQEQCAKLGLLFSGDSLPRVAITEEQMRKFTETGVMSEEQVVEAFVLANKLNQTAEDIVAMMKAGTGEAAIYEMVYAKKFGTLSESSR